ncbi:MAG: peptide chain release factor 2 [Planctomycetaceae bacterium]|nr:peptide chain release factor 2 [Planctomycetaceae bacterium]
MAVENEWINRAHEIQDRLVQLKDSLDCAAKQSEAKKIEAEMTAAGFWDNQEKAQQIVSRLKALKAIIKPFEEMDAELKNIDVLFEFGHEDDEMAAEIPGVLTKLTEKLETLETQALLNAPYDANNAIITINARDGGTDANDWAEMLFRMYSLWAKENDYNVELIDWQENEEAGINSCGFVVRGPMAYGYLKGESGIHRLVRISPFNSEGKRQTSFAAVDVSPEIDDSIQIDVRDEDVREDTMRASGAGGQHVNKTSSAIRLTHLPTNTVVYCQMERSQHKNRAMAWKMLRARLIRAEEEKREMAMAERYKNMAKVGFGSQIRNYFLHPDQRVKDARTGYSVGNFHAVLDGHIQEFLESFLRWRVKTEE